MKKIMLFIVVLALFTGTSRAVDKNKVTARPIPPGTNYLNPPALKVLNPNGGETWGIGGYVHVCWSATNVTQNVNVWITVAGSAGIFMIGQSLPPGTQDAAYTVPANFGYSGKIFKMVVATADGKVRDESDDTFTIRKMNVSAWMKDSSEQQYTGACPVTLNFNAQIGTEFPGWVNYSFFYEDGSESPTFSVFVATVKDVVCARTIGGSLAGHVTLRIQSPSQANSANSAFFNVHCTGGVK
jgi:hypothetical protein